MSSRSGSHPGPEAKPSSFARPLSSLPAWVVLARIILTAEPAIPAAAPVQPTANISYGSQGPIPPVTTAETSSANAPTVNPYEAPNT